MTLLDPLLYAAQTGAHQIHLLFRRCNAAFALFLKAMQHEHHLGKLHRVDGPVGAARIVFHQFQYARTAKPMQYLGILMALTTLRQIKGMSKK